MDTILAHARRRQALAKKIGDGVAVLAAAAPAVKSRDTDYFPYRQDSYFYYLTGCTEPKTALLLLAQGGKLKEEIFLCPPHDALVARWEGKRLSPRSAKRQLGIADTADITELPTLLRQLAAGQGALHYIPGADAGLDALVIDSLKRRRAGNRQRQTFPTTITDITAVLDDMRLIKDAAEVAHLRAACDLTAEGIMTAMHAVQYARHEHEVEAAILAVYRAGGGTPAFAPIVAGGQNACVLHYTANNARLANGKALLVDSGCEMHGYAGDITRCFPINGEWSGGFADVYAVVLAAQRAALAAAKPGATLQTLEKAARRKLAQGLRELKLCRGSVESILAKESYRRFYMHGIGHFLGLDVHDVGAAYEENGKPRRLRPGMVLTVEPGLYISPDDDVPPALAGIGVRIEDDILITKNGNEVLTAAAPKTPAQIRAWMRQA